jgi:hypothetical protein
MSGIPVFRSPVAARVHAFAGWLRDVAHWIEHRYRKRKGLPPSQNPFAGSRP